jgi:LysR family hydrogen peroxide-inducible transcriptional activator
MKERPTLRQLEYFVALAEHLNFQRAAEACYVTQPTLSVQLQQLEALLGVTLFERTKRKVLPTPAGKTLVEQARRTLRLVDELLDEAQGHGAPLSGPLRLGVIPTIAPYLLPSLLGRLRERYPGLRLYVREDPTERLLDALQRGELDVLLLAREARLGDVVFLEILRDSFYLAVPREHRLARRKKVAERDLVAERLILLEDGH